MKYKKQERRTHAASPEMSGDEQTGGRVTQGTPGGAHHASYLKTSHKRKKITKQILIRWFDEIPFANGGLH